MREPLPPYIRGDRGDATMKDLDLTEEQKRKVEAIEIAIRVASEDKIRMAQTAITHTVSSHSMSQSEIDIFLQSGLEAAQRDLDRQRLEHSKLESHISLCSRGLNPFEELARVVKGEGQDIEVYTLGPDGPHRVGGFNVKEG